MFIIASQENCGICILGLTNLLSNVTMELTESFQLLGDSSQLELLMRLIQDHLVCASSSFFLPVLFDHHPCFTGRCTTARNCNFKVAVQPSRENSAANKEGVDRALEGLKYYG